MRYTLSFHDRVFDILNADYKNDQKRSAETFAIKQNCGWFGKRVLECHWWLVRVTLVVAFAFCSKILGDSLALLKTKLSALSCI